MKSRGERDRLIELASDAGALRSREITGHGISRATVQRMVREGLMERVAHGLYALADREPTEHATLVEVATRIPRGVVCLLSALSFHRIGTQLPPQVWIAIDRKAWKPRIQDLPVRMVRFSGRALTEGVEEHVLEGVRVQVYGPEKTVADCFKYRNKIGLDVALEALDDCHRRRLCDADRLWHFAKVCRVSTVMEPYLEVIG